MKKCPYCGKKFKSLPIHIAKIHRNPKKREKFEELFSRYTMEIRECFRELGGTDPWKQKRLWKKAREKALKEVLKEFEKRI